MNVFRYAPKNRMATLKKKNEPCVSSTNNLNLQNQLRKINHNEQSLNNSKLLLIYRDIYHLFL